MPDDPLFAPLVLGPLTLPHRVWMAPLTRSRCTTPGDLPNDLMQRYYVQRAGAALIVSEPLWLHPLGRGYALTPGLVNEEQVAGWRRICDAVHAAGGHLAAQLWHVGRVSHPALLPPGEVPVAPSAIRAETKVYVDEVATMVDAAQPRALDETEIEAVIADFAAGARRALDAGFDLIELHGASGYLLDQFTRSGSNRRDDAWGGDRARRRRFPVEVARACAEAIGASRVGYRIQPLGTFNAMEDDDPEATFSELADDLGALGLAYLHVIETEGERTALCERISRSTRERFRAAGGGAYIANGRYDGSLARTRLREGLADAVSFGVPYIANPDLDRRLREDLPWRDADRATFYTGGEKGYADYPFAPDS